MRQLLRVMTLGGLLLLSRAGAQTVFADDFSSGNPVAGTTYQLVAPGGFSAQGQYRVVADPGSAFLNGYASYFDHTLGTAGGQMLFFDGASNASAIWSRSALLTGGVTYSFSFWLSGAVPTSPCICPLIGTAIGGAIGGSAVVPVAASWQQVSHTFTAPTTHVETFAIIDLNRESAGNAGAIDDIVLAAVPELPPWSLLVAGMAACAALARRRTKA